MRKLFLLTAVITFMVAFATNGLTATTITFENLTPGYYPSIVYSGVTFTNNAGNLEVYDINSSSPLLPPLSGNAIIGPHVWGANNFNVATFSIAGVRSVSVDIGDYNADTDNLFFKAYGASNNLLGSTSAILPPSLYGGYTLSLTTSADISYVLFGSLGTDTFPGSIYSDNFTYTSNAVPVPPSLLLLAPGLLGIGVIRRRFTK